MNQNIKLRNDINLLYHKWQTSTDEKISYLSFISFTKKLKELTKRTLTSSKLLSQLEDIYSEMLLIVYNEQQKSKINTIDYFSAWYSQVMKNYIRNFIKEQNRKKRKIVVYESSMVYSLEVAEVKHCMDVYVKEEALANAKDLLELIFNDSKDKTILECHIELFKERHVLGVSIKELAKANNTTIDGIKSKLKRTKLKLKKKYMKLESLNI